MTAPELRDDQFEAAARWCLVLAEASVSEEEHERFQAWLDEDPRHGAAFARAASAWRAVDHHAAAAEMLALRSSALELARQTQASRRRRSFDPRMLALAAAALAAVVVMVGAVMLGSRAEAYSTGPGERRVIVLADGSRLSLDAATLVKVRIDGHERRLWLEQGRAKFDVAKDPLKPFSVRALDRVVVATGTSFSVEILQRKVRVVLYEGHVALLDGRGARPTPIRLVRSAGPALTPGHEAIIADQPAATVGAADLIRSHAWEAGQLFFDDEPLGEAVERVNRYGGVQLAAAPDAAAVRISGMFNAGDAAAFVDGVTTVFPVRAEQRDGHTVLVRRAGGNPAPGVGSGR